jgi:putative transposase
MPRQARVVSPGVPHHIYTRGNNRRRLFSNDADRLLWVRCLERGLEASECALHQHTLMTNHVHLMATPPNEKALSVLMKETCQRYAQERNRRKNASGKLFEQRFHSKIIDDERYLLYTLLYNDANAYRAGLVDDPTAHCWSTGPLHAGTDGSRIPRSLWTPLVFYTRLGPTRETRGRAYRLLMATYLRDPSWIPVDDKSGGRRYRQRIERPDGSMARESMTQWGRKAKR